MVVKVSVNGYLASGNNIWWHYKASSKKHGNGNNIEILTLTLQSLLLFMADMVMHERKKCMECQEVLLMYSSANQKLFSEKLILQTLLI